MSTPAPVLPPTRRERRFEALMVRATYLVAGLLLGLTLGAGWMTSTR